MKVAIEDALCQGHGRCYELVPEVFTDDDRGRGSVIEPEVPAALVERTETAVRVCPERAISVGD